MQKPFLNYSVKWSPGVDSNHHSAPLLMRMSLEFSLASMLLLSDSNAKNFFLLIIFQLDYRGVGGRTDLHRLKVS